MTSSRTSESKETSFSFNISLNRAIDQVYKFDNGNIVMYGQGEIEIFSGIDGRQITPTFEIKNLREICKVGNFMMGNSISGRIRIFDSNMAELGSTEAKLDRFPEKAIRLPGSSNSFMLVDNQEIPIHRLDLNDPTDPTFTDSTN